MKVIWKMKITDFIKLSAEFFMMKKLKIENESQSKLLNQSKNRIQFK